MYLALLFVPLLGSLAPMLLGAVLGVSGSRLLSTSCIGLACILALIAFFEVVVAGSPVSVHLGSWVSSGTLSVDWAFLFDGLTVSMLLPVLVVSTLVHVYSCDYMGSDPHQQRFFSYLSMFTFWMVLLVTGDNYFILFLGWEGIGVSSYLLISFWYTRLQAVKSAIEAMLVNRVGDMFFSLGIYACFWALGSLDYETVFSATLYANESTLTIIGLLFLCAAMGKSAQLGLHTWLPLAMEGPTPVSALIHAATLVTAGVYLLLRSSPILVYAPTALICITWVGAVTAVFAATTGLVQNDIKRVIAYSTCSQMGYLFMAAGLTAFDVSLFHLVNHAFFKAVLFLSAGGVLHSMSDQQDMRRLGGLVGLLPLTYTVVLIGSLSLMALPFLTGFYSKDLILESGFGAYTVSGHLVYWLGSFTAFLTAFYSFRLISLTFLSEPNSNRASYERTHEQPIIVIIPLVLLALLSIAFGYIARDTYLGLGTDSLANSILLSQSQALVISAEFAIPQWSKLLPFIVTVLGAGSSLLAYQFYGLSLSQIKGSPETLVRNMALVSTTPAWNTTANPVALANPVSFKGLYQFLLGKWQFDLLLNHFLTRKGMAWALYTSQVLDRGLLELIGPRGLTGALWIGSESISTLDTAKVTDYALLITVGLTGLVLVICSYYAYPYIVSLSDGQLEALTLAQPLFTLDSIEPFILVYMIILVFLLQSRSQDYSH